MRHVCGTTLQWSAALTSDEGCAVGPVGPFVMRLQWSAALTSDEGAHDGRGARRSQHASMERRSHERRRLLDILAELSGEYGASMERRSHERRRTPLRTHVSRSPRFNGAPLSRATKVRAWSRIACALPSFNGAPLSRATKDEPPHRHGVPRVPLQWSAALTSDEGSVPRLSRMDCVALQWSAALTSDEGAHRMGHRGHRRAALQWSAALTSDEGSAH